MSAQSQGPVAVVLPLCFYGIMECGGPVGAAGVCNHILCWGQGGDTCTARPVCCGVRPGSELWLPPGRRLMATGLGPSPD